MDVWTHGLALTVVGMGGTIFSLWLITVLINGLKKLFPYKESEERERNV